ncbi:Plant disease resistance response protein [Corchorus olitorius]|uniref:Dirigent protein n=1 Tax=Corchorus olitorius TaxID=93759 RepID=A0A1R3JD92_9ROSI|nr:Plant disease resistance response protein [Corchorus olitorius]
MEIRRLILAWILVVCTAKAPYCHSDYYTPSEPYVPPSQQVTQLHFFIHDIIGGQNPSAILVARPNFTIANDTPIPFGSVYATDNPVTFGPNLTSGIVGNARGLWASAGQDKLTLVIYWDLGFTHGKFNGSSINIFSRYPITETQGELAVVGGRGQFRMAQGFALLRTYSADSSTNNAILECNATVIHH